MNILEKICGQKRKSLENRKSSKSQHQLILEINGGTDPIDFKQQILKSNQENKPALIAEIKKASPSHGLIKENFNPLSIAQSYQSAGATALSILTEEDYFQGKDEYLTTVREKIKLPILRKDFVVDEYQIYESRLLGASCILLIAAALTDEQMKCFYATASELNMSVLFEVHNQEELNRVLPLQPQILGINNRNLKTLKIDIQTSLDLYPQIPADVITVAESGIQNHEQLSMLHNAGFNAFLVGESLMRQDDIETATKKLLFGD